MKKLNTLLAVLFLFLLFAPQFVSAQINFNQTLTAQEEANLNQILTPVMKIYNMVKYIATAIAALVLLLAGINYIVGGSDPKKRENAKGMAMYVVIGLVIVWAAPMVVQFIIS